ncbi:interleukin 17-like protein [Haliotis cracherodii]|uniref:interleukin 17-like protein n=1 Tax=Haliotis cracherodii TaxID=6455 RepID=UPI0039EC1ED0
MKHVLETPLLLAVICLLNNVSMATNPYCPSRQSPQQDESYYILPGMEHISRGPGQVSYFRGIRQCPRSLSRRGSMCPVHYVINYNADRTPTLIVEARCTCSNCRSGTGVTRHRCMPVYYYREVEEMDHIGSCINKVIRRFTVGCQCAAAEDRPTHSVVSSP